MLFYDWLKYEKLIKELPIDKDRWPKAKFPKREVEYLTKDEIKAIFDYLNSQLKIEKKNKYNRLALMDLVIFAISYYTAFRREEIVKIQVEDFNFKECTITTIGKGNKQRTIPYQNKEFLTDLVKKYLRIMEINKGYIFPSIRNRKNDSATEYISKEYVNKLFNRISKETGIYVYPHKSRKTCLNELHNWIDIFDVRDYAGHSSESTTKKYVAPKKCEQLKRSCVKVDNDAFVKFN
jgi:integrase